MDMDNARIVTLEQGSGDGTVTFEEAFGEHSELRGRGRARRQSRRQERRMKRISNKRQRKLAKQDMRLEKKRRRRALKDEGEDQEPEESTSQDTSAYDPEPEEQEESYEGGEVSEQEEEPMEEQEQADGESSFDAETRSNPAYDDITKRIQSNLAIIQKTKEELTQVEGMLKSKVPSNVMARLLNRRQVLKTTLNARVERVRELQKKLEAFSEARGGRRGVVGGRKFGRPGGMRERRRVRREIPVDPDLNANVSENRIEVPAPADNFSGFGGGKSGNKPKIVPIIVGCALIGLTIYAIHHYSKKGKKA